MAASSRLYKDVAISIQLVLKSTDNLNSRVAVMDLVGWLCLDFATDNPHFKRERFIEACGLTVEQVDSIGVSK